MLQYNLLSGALGKGDPFRDRDGLQCAIEEIETVKEI